MAGRPGATGRARRRSGRPLKPTGGCGRISAGGSWASEGNRKTALLTSKEARLQALAASSPFCGCTSSHSEGSQEQVAFLSSGS